MGSQQVFCLRWSNHQSNMLSVFDELLQTETLVDVTIACEGLSMKAHKVVLSACSPYFQTLFLQNPCKHPIVILKDIKYSELKALIDFMYKGEVNVTQEQLSTLLKTAETLKIKGLAEVTGGVNGQQTDDSDKFSPASFERKVFHNIARSMNPASDSRSSTPPHPPPPPPPPPLPASAPLPLLSSQLSSTMPSHSPPTKRKKMRPKRRSPEANHSNNNEEGESVKVQGSPEMLETKVEVTSDEFDHVPSRTSDHDEQMDQPSDLQTDSNQESLDNPFPSQGQANPSNEEFSASGEPMPATSPSFTPLSLLQKLKSPGPSTSSGMSSQDDLYYENYEQTLLDFTAQAAAAASDNTCPVCGITFRYRNNLYRHRRTHCDTRVRHGCHLCGKTFSRKDTLQLHARVKHQNLPPMTFSV